MVFENGDDTTKKEKRINAFGIIVLIVIIGPLLLAVFWPERNMTKEERAMALERMRRLDARTECHQLHKLTDAYRIEKTDGTLPSDFELEMLMFGNEPYVAESSQLLDNWGNPFHFKQSGPEPTNFYIYSSGPDGTLNTDDDITSGEKTHDNNPQ